MPQKSRTNKPPELTEAQARDRALRALSRREHSAAELKYKLTRRGLDETAAVSVVQTLGEAGWQSDARYAEMLVRNRIEQGYGPMRIEAELEHAGVPAEEITTALAAAEVDWLERIHDLHRRKFGHTPRSAADWQKQYRYLASRGFLPDHIRSILKHSDHDAE